MSRSRLTVILYSAACAETASAASDAPAIAVRAVMPTIPKRRRIAYSLRFPNQHPSGAQIALAKCPGGLAPTLHVRKALAKTAPSHSGREGGLFSLPALCGGGPNPMLWRSPRLDIRGLYHLRPRQQLRPDPPVEFFRRAGDHFVAERCLTLSH